MIWWEFDDLIFMMIWWLDISKGIWVDLIWFYELCFYDRRFTICKRKCRIFSKNPSIRIKFDVVILYRSSCIRFQTSLGIGMSCGFLRGVSGNRDPFKDTRRLSCVRPSGRGVTQVVMVLWYEIVREKCWELMHQNRLDLLILSWWKQKLQFVLEFAHEMGMRNIILEGDVLTVIKKLQAGESDLSPIGILTSEAKLRASLFNSCSFNHVRRTNN